MPPPARPEEPRYIRCEVKMLVAASRLVSWYSSISVLEDPEIRGESREWSTTKTPPRGPGKGIPKLPIGKPTGTPT
eukprot:Skav232105  [mRNA]  locus=scaffold2353:115471:115698:- [translate_table: standard]